MIRMISSKSRIAILVPGILIIFCMLFPAACKKSSEPFYSVIPADIRENFLFQKGSYWIYQNNLSGRVDSVRIEKDPEFGKETIYNDDGTVAGYDDRAAFNYVGSIIHSCSIMTSTVYVSTTVSYPSIDYFTSMVPGRSYPYNGIVSYVQHLDSLKINDRTYYDIKHLMHSVVFTNGDSAIVNALFSRHTGMIQLTSGLNGHDTTWSLLRYHVIQ
jgi:hypothetical protein